MLILSFKVDIQYIVEAYMLAFNSSTTLKGYHGFFPASSDSFTQHKPPGCLHVQRQGISQLCTHTQCHKWGSGHAYQTKSRRPPSHLSPIPDMLIPTVVAGRRGGDRLEVSASRCEHAVRPCQKTAIREGLERKQLLLWGGIWEEGKNFEEIAYPLLPSMCYDSMAFKGWSQT